jgi:hypothetical protein
MRATFFTSLSAFGSEVVITGLAIKTEFIGYSLHEVKKKEKEDKPLLKREKGIKTKPYSYSIYGKKRKMTGCFYECSPIQCN